MGRLFNLFRRIVEAASVVGGQFSKVGLFLMMMLITYDVIARYVFMKPTLFIDEISGYLLVMVAFMAVPMVTKEDRHIRMDVLSSRLPASYQVWLELILSIISILAIGVVLWRSIILTHNLYVRGVLFGSVLYTPLYIPQSFIPIGLTLLILQYIVEVVKLVRHKILKTTDIAS